MKDLTEREVKILDAVVAFQIDPRGVVPRLRELMEGDQHASGAWHGLRNIERKGFIKVDDENKTVTVLKRSNGEAFKQHTPATIKRRLRDFQKLFHAAKYEDADVALNKLLGEL